MGLWEHCQIAEDVAVGVKGRTLSFQEKEKKKRQKLKERKGWVTQLKQKR